MRPILALKLRIVRIVTSGVKAALEMLPAPVRAIVADQAPMVRPMDYRRARILLHVDSSVEYSVRLRSAKKEPETVRWIEGFSDGDVLYDIGANVGAYSLIAAKLFQGRVRVCAFEPSPLNFGQLLKNLAVNECGDTVMPLPVALGDVTRMQVFNYRNTTRGGALHSIGEPVDEEGRPFVPAMRQPLLVYSLDDAVKRYGLDPPAHLKIDVDGGESAILAGASATLASPSLRSVLMEANTAGGVADRITERMAQSGFRLDTSYPQVRGYVNLMFVRSHAPAPTGPAGVHSRG